MPAGSKSVVSRRVSTTDEFTTNKILSQIGVAAAFLGSRLRAVNHSEDAFWTHYRRRRSAHQPVASGRVAGQGVGSN